MPPYFFRHRECEGSEEAGVDGGMRHECVNADVFRNVRCMVCVVERFLFQTAKESETHAEEC